MSAVDDKSRRGSTKSGKRIPHNPERSDPVSGKNDRTQANDARTGVPCPDCGARNVHDHRWWCPVWDDDPLGLEAAFRQDERFVVEDGGLCPRVRVQRARQRLGAASGTRQRGRV